MALISSNGTGGGNWSVAATWAGGVVPAEGDCATIVAGDTVTIDDAAPAAVIIGDDHVGAAYAITINGKLQYLSTATIDHVFRCKGDLVNASGGTIEIGIAANPIPAARTFTIELNYSAAPADGKYGFKNYGSMILQGDPNRVNVVKCLLNADAGIGDTNLTTDVSTGWKEDDKIAIASTTRTWSQAEDGSVYGGDAVGTNVPFLSHTPPGGLLYAHSGTSPTQAEIINLTRNVKVTSYNTSYRGYLCCYIGSTSDVDYVEFYMIGYNATYKHGIEIRTTAVAATNFAYCSVWGEASKNNSFSIRDAHNVVVDNCMIYDTKYEFYVSSDVDNCVITNNILMNIPYHGFVIENVENTIEDNVATSCYYSGFYISSSSDITSFKNNSVHSNSSYGLIFYYCTGGNLENFTSWRNNHYGLYLSRIRKMSIDNLTAFGNSTANALCTQSNIILTTMSFNGDSSFSTSYGIYNAGENVKCDIEDGILGQASGIKTTHTTADIYFASNAYNTMILKNCKLSSATKVTNINNAIISSYVQCEDLDQVQYSDKAWYKYGIVVRDSTTFKTGSYAMRFDQFWAADDWLDYEVEIPVKDGESVVVSAWLRKNASYTSANRPKIKISGMGISATEDQMSNVTDTWEKVSVSGTPSRTGMAKLTIMTYLTNAGASAWCDFEKTGLTMPVLNTLEGSFWADGHIAKILFDTGSITAAEFWKTLTADIDKAGSFANLFKDYLDAQLSIIKAQTDKMHFSGNNIQSRVADKGTLNNPPSEAIEDYKATGFSTHTPGNVRTEMEGAGTKLTLIKDETAFLKSIEGGKWKIISDQMIFYKEDNITEVARFNLLDKDGVATEKNVMERVRV